MDIYPPPFLMAIIQGMGERSERTPILDRKLNVLVKEGILQPISAIHNPNHPTKLAYLNSHLKFNNPDYDFSIGVPPQLPLMLALGESKKRPDLVVYCRPDHRRSGLVTSESGIFLNTIPLVFLDEKGLGNLDEQPIITSLVGKRYVHAGSTMAKTSPKENETWGLVNLEDALHDAKSTDLLSSYGIRIVPTVAILVINKVLNEEGIYISLDEAIKKELIGKKAIPAVQFRCFITPFRASEFIYSTDYRLSNNKRQRLKTMFLEGMSDMSKDKSIPIDFFGGEQAIPEYLNWFAETFGQNLGKLHKRQLVHQWLHEMHNTTLDVRIIDSDDLLENASDRDIEQERATLFKQYPDIHSAFWKYLDSVINLFHLPQKPDNLLEIAVSAYNSEYN